MKGRVFISSAINEFRSERQIAKSLERLYSFLEFWVFEEEAASSASLERSYQGPLEKSDLVIFLLGSDITPPVLAEVDSALRHNKRTLLILREVPKRSQPLQDAIKKLDVKYAAYTDTGDFERLLRSAVENELVNALQSPPERFGSDPKYRALRDAFAGSAAIRIEPLVGPSNDNRFRIVELSLAELTVEKVSSQHRVTIQPTSISEIVANGVEFSLAVNGRIQWITTQNVYKLLPGTPKDELGVPKVGSPGDPNVSACQEKLKMRGYYTQWNQLGEATFGGYEVAYDDDGKYFRCEGRMRGWIEILVARRQ